MVPVYNFGETSLYHQIPNERGSFIRRLQQAFKSTTGVAPIICSGRGFINRRIGLIPIQTKLTSVGKNSNKSNKNIENNISLSVGAPIHVEKNSNPSKKEIDYLHNEYVSALIKLFDDHKVKYGIPEDTKLRIV